MPDSLKLLRSDSRRLERFWNTYIRIPLPWRGSWFPHRHWQRLGVGDPHGPSHYVELQDGSFVLLEEVTRQLESFDSSVLDLGCNVGRHLNALLCKGYHHLFGVDVQAAALEHSKVVFPGLAGVAKLSLGRFQDYLPTVPDRHFDVVFTFGATVELVPPWFPLCAEIGRVTRKSVVLAISETGHAYPRLWEQEFLRAGFLLTLLRRPICPGYGISLLVFQRIDN